MPKKSELDFWGLVAEIKELVTKHKYSAELIPYDCKGISTHKHVGLRFHPPDVRQRKSNGNVCHLNLWEALALVRYGRTDKNAVNKVLCLYSDEKVSCRAVVMASEYMDWLSSGYGLYVEVRFILMKELSITEEGIRKMLKENKIPVAGC